MTAEQDPNIYFRDLQQLAVEQDRAKLVTLAVEFGSTLQQLPKLREEMEAFLAPGQMLDYIGLTENTRPQLEQAAALLFELGDLPAELRNAPEIKAYAETLETGLVLQTVAPLTQKLSSVCSAVKLRIAQEKAETERIAKEKAETERKAKEKAEAERKLREKLEAERIAREKAETERLAKEKAESERIKTELRTLTVEFASTLQQLPKLRAEMDAFLVPEQLLDYVGLMKNIRPQLEQAAALLFELKDLPAELRNAPEIKAFAQTLETGLVLQTVTPLTNKFPSVCSIVRQRIAQEKAETERIAKEKAETERKEKEKAEAERKLREKVEAERIVREKAEAERLAKAKKDAELNRKFREKFRANKEARVIAWEKAEAEAERKRTGCILLMITGIIGAFLGWKFGDTWFGTVMGTILGLIIANSCFWEDR